jgi:hypothetical protein
VSAVAAGSVESVLNWWVEAPSVISDYYRTLLYENKITGV